MEIAASNSRNMLLLKPQKAEGTRDEYFQAAVGYTEATKCLNTKISIATKEDKDVSLLKYRTFSIEIL